MACGGFNGLGWRTDLAHVDNCLCLRALSAQLLQMKNFLKVPVRIIIKNVLSKLELQISSSYVFGPFKKLPHDVS